jgi:hypothetical protein
MSDASTRHIIEMYMDEATAPMFLSGFFQSPPRNFHTSEKVEIDVLRDDEEVAIAIQDLSVGARENESTLYVNKAFAPPIFDEAGTVSAYNLAKRHPGQNPYQDPDYAKNALEEAFTIFRKLERKIRRAVELMCAQVLQTGRVTCRDKAGNALFTLDFGARSTHFPTAGTAWGGGSANIIGDISALAEAVRSNGRKAPSKLLFGARAWQDFIADATILKYLESRRADFGLLQPGGGAPAGGAPAVRGEGASYNGFIWLGQYKYELWTYSGSYRDPVTNTHKPYLDQDSVVVLSDNSRLDLTFGAIPFVRRPDVEALAFLPPRLSDSDRGLDLTTNVWFTPDNRHLKVSAGTRPLPIPTAIDTFGCLKTRA